MQGGLILFEQIEWSRLFLVLLVQVSVMLFFFYLTIKIFRRNKSSLTKLLSSFYFCIGISFLINLFYLFSTDIDYIMILYFTGAFTFMLAFYFLFAFTIFLTRLPMKKKSLGYIFIIFSTILLFLFSLPQGVIINQNLRPTFSWTYLTISYIVFTIFYAIPINIFSLKAYKNFSNEFLRRKFKYFIIGTNGFFINFYGLILYNTWENELFKLIWSLVSLIVVPCGILTYLGIGKQIKMEAELPKTHMYKIFESPKNG